MFFQLPFAVILIRLIVSEVHTNGEYTYVKFICFKSRDCSKQDATCLITMACLYM